MTNFIVHRQHPNETLAASEPSLVQTKKWTIDFFPKQTKCFDLIVAFRLFFKSKSNLRLKMDPQIFSRYFENQAAGGTNIPKSV